MTTKLKFFYIPDVHQCFKIMVHKTLLFPATAGQLLQCQEMATLLIRRRESLRTSV